MGPVQDKNQKSAIPALPPKLTDAQLLLRAEHADPFSYLGPHPVDRHEGRRIAIRAVQPHAVSVTILIAGREIPANLIEKEGLFEAILPQEISEVPSPRDYRLRIRWDDGNTSEIVDPYAFPPVLTEFDLHLIGEGNHYKLYDTLGAHVCEMQGIRGVSFAVWAPNAERVS